VDGALAAFFALLVVIIIVNAIVICWRAFRSTEPLPSSEAPYVESRLLVPAGRAPAAGDEPAERP
jgi:carbon starvation protein